MHDTGTVKLPNRCYVLSSIPSPNDSENDYTGDDKKNNSACYYSPNPLVPFLLLRNLSSYIVTTYSYI